MMSGIYNLLYPDKTALRGIKPNNLDNLQVCFDFGKNSGNFKTLFVLIFAKISLKIIINQIPLNKNHKRNCLQYKGISFVF
jgi:hypothetical protein